MLKSYAAASSRVVVKLPGFEASIVDRQQHQASRTDVTLESLTRSYRESLQLASSDDDDEETEEKLNDQESLRGRVAKVASVAKQQQSPTPVKSRGNTRKSSRNFSATTGLLTSAADDGGGSTRRSALPATVFNPDFKFNSQLYMPSGYFLVTHRMGQRASMEWRRQAVQNQPRVKLLRFLGESGGLKDGRSCSSSIAVADSFSGQQQILRQSSSARSARNSGGVGRVEDVAITLTTSRPATARSNSDGPGESRQLVSLSSLIKRFPDDFVRLPIPTMLNGQTGCFGTSSTGGNQATSTMHIKSTSKPIRTSSAKLPAARSGATRSTTLKMQAAQIQQVDSGLWELCEDDVESGTSSWMSLRIQGRQASYHLHQDLPHGFSSNSSKRCRSAR